MLCLMYLDCCATVDVMFSCWGKYLLNWPPFLLCMFNTEETYQERQCRLVKSCVTTFHPSLREEQVSTATFMSSLNRTHTSTSRRISDHCNGEQTYLIIIYSIPTLVERKYVQMFGHKIVFCELCKKHWADVSPSVIPLKIVHSTH